MRPLSVPQILRCLTLGRYTARVEDGHLRIRGPQPLDGPLPDSIKANRGELIEFLTEWAGGAWPPASGSRIREAQQFLNCGLSVALDAYEAMRGRRAA